MTLSSLRNSGLIMSATLLALALGAAAAQETGADRAFLAGCESVMTAMHAGMAIRPSGDVDTDFAAMMIPHHQGAIDMALLELRYGRNEQLRRIAQEIIADQQQEIAAMRLATGLPPAKSDGAQSAPSGHHHAPEGAPQ